MTEISTWVRDRVSADVDLDREAMVRLACEIVGAEELWRPYAQYDAETRFYRQLYRDPNLDVWLICWVDGQRTGYHDHDRSSGAVCVCEGTLYEDWFRVEEDGWVRERTTVHTAGGTFDFDAADIHGVRHPAPSRRPPRRSTCTRPPSGAWGTTSPARAACGPTSLRGRAPRRRLSPTGARDPHRSYCNSGCKLIRGPSWA